MTLSEILQICAMRLRSIQDKGYTRAWPADRSGRVQPAEWALATGTRSIRTSCPPGAIAHTKWWHLTFRHLRSKILHPFKPTSYFSLICWATRRPTVRLQTFDSPVLGAASAWSPGWCCTDAAWCVSGHRSPRSSNSPLQESTRSSTSSVRCLDSKVANRPCQY